MVILMETSTAVSQSTIYFSNYVPPADSENSSEQQTTVSTSRGCSENDAELTLVVPEKSIAQTSTPHPTFLFHLSSIPSQPLRVSVTEPNVVKSIFEQDFTVKKAGFYANLHSCLSSQFMSSGNI
ncbi:MAG: DUF928 domain-containing protein [Hydrococcus sp. RM1_1_31]|nr:DUF928 domain-containing protein [Hydrococcus sp. RM1_1_31]